MNKIETTEIQEKIISWLLATPKALAILAVSLISGQLWFFVIVTYCKTKSKGNIYLNNIYSKTAMGFLWFSLINLPIHLIRNGIYVTEENILSNYLYTILYGVVIQAMILIYIVSFKREK